MTRRPAPRRRAGDEPAATRLELPYPVSVNDLYRPVVHRGQARFILSDAARRYRQTITEAVLIQRSKRHRDPSIGAARHGSDPLALRILMHPPDDKKKHDIDNVLKALLDGLKHAGVFDDDAQIEDLHVTRCQPDAAKGRVVVEITSLEGAA